jgi:hypothetical protein
MEKIKKTTNSFNYRVKCDNIADILEGFLFKEFNQASVNDVARRCGDFLLTEKGVHPEILKKFGIYFRMDSDEVIQCFGINLVSSLCIIDVFPPNHEDYLDKDSIEFEGKFYQYNAKTKRLKIRRVKK